MTKHPTKQTDNYVFLLYIKYESLFLLITWSFILSVQCHTPRKINDTFSYHSSFLFLKVRLLRIIHDSSDTSVRHLWILKLTNLNHPVFEAPTCLKNWTRFVLSLENFSHTSASCFFALSRLYWHDSQLETVLLNHNSNYPVWRIYSAGKMGHYVNLLDVYVFLSVVLQGSFRLLNWILGFP